VGRGSYQGGAAYTVATYGGVSPKSKKQRMASMQLAATQGKSETEIKIAGSRNFDWVNQANIRARQQRELRARQQAGLAGGSPDWRPEARDDGGGDCLAGQDLMATCHGVRMARVASIRGACPGNRWSVPFGSSLTVRARGSMNETDKPSGERASVSEPVPAAA
jgi:hypothetical protein